MPDVTADSPPIGIDLGTTFSVVAFLDATGRPVSLPNSHGDLLTPSAILFDDGEIIVGKEAWKSSVVDPERYVECVKRDMGSERYRRPINGWDVPPEVLSALILERLREDAQRRIGPIRDVVITVPAFFDESRRRVTHDAGRLAGLNVLDIINEPTAAAIAYGFLRDRTSPVADASRKPRVLVFDLGGGTFDVTILEIDGTRFRTLATDGDIRLGGKDFDERVVHYLADEFLKQHGLDPRSDPRDAAQLWVEAQDVKHTLSERQRAHAVVTHAGIRLRVELSRDTLHGLVKDLVERTTLTTNLLIREAGLAWTDIDRVLLVGGSTRMPLVVDAIRRMSGREPDLSLAADEAVAHGAAIYAGMLRTRDDQSPLAKFDFTNVNSHSLGVAGIDPKTKRRRNLIVIPRNTTLPHRVVRRFATAKENQRDVQVKIVEGESQNPDECIAIGKCVVAGLPSRLAKGSPIDVEFCYAANGMISVTAREVQHRVSAQVTIKRREKNEDVDLETWKQRLTGPPRDAPARETTLDAIADRPLPEASPGDLASCQLRLDAIYERIGIELLRTAGPAPLQAAHDAARQALAAARLAQQQWQRVDSLPRPDAGTRESIGYHAELAKARIELQDAQRQFSFACLVLGRESVAANLTPPRMQSWLREVRQLRDELSQ